MSCQNGTTRSQTALSARCAGRNSESGQRKSTELILPLKKKSGGCSHRVKIKGILKCFGVFLASVTEKQFKNNNNLV